MSQQRPLNRQTVIVIVIMLCVALAAYANHWRRVKSFNPKLLSATYLTTPRAISPFSLEDTEGKPFTNENLKGKWTLLFFGFTRCGYICPTTMAVLGQTIDMMITARSQKQPDVVFVSVDSERDTREKVQQYVASFNPKITGVLGDEAEVRLFAKEMAVVFMKVATQSDKQAYDINHSSTIVLINPQGKLQAFFTPPHLSTQIAKEFVMIANQQ